MYRIKAQFYRYRRDEKPAWEVIINKIETPLQMLNRYEFAAETDNKNRISFLKEVSEDFLSDELMSYNGQDKISEMQDYNQALISTILENGECEKMVLCIYDTSLSLIFIS